MNTDPNQIENFVNGFANFIENLNDDEWDDLSDDNVAEFFDKCKENDNET